ncbi:MAG: glycerophosphodiester phosphodiesterase [Gammaproteobacteria bacterium]|nr:glycerophosphodiester phosphodiesterase [Gammaproteobacteria bacterium]NND38791.1 glycerophosphodiester phosphodiesterase [Pseudomonadales bacterium]MBT8151866.1 glycerophosphodiester phosphodiesterase [Gammaproteobacteria bacterium]NNL10930.1 glycerophosphodiester phosphodiesterase [Pseudomonadales bacterium]NNM10863.1 glycerophosphodiester phosphodiesterase [Pseudomonadales bacterium]
MLVFGHRGAAGEAPENTVAGVRRAIEAGVTRIEIDLRLSADRQLVVLHDRSLWRTAARKVNIDEIHSRELASTDASHALPGWHGEACPVPLLQDLLASAPELETVQLELKSDASTDVDALVGALQDLFPTARSARKVVTTSFDSEIIAELAKHAPHIRRGIVAKRDPIAAMHTALELDCDYLCLMHKLMPRATREILESLQQSQLHISCWTVNKVADLAAQQRAGTHSVITDLPGTLVPLCKKQPERSQ